MEIYDQVIVNGISVKVPRSFEYSKCKYCGNNEIIWGVTDNSKNIPIRFDINKGWVCHLEECKK